MTDLAALKVMIEGAYRGDHARIGWTHEADLATDERIAAAELSAIFADPDIAVFVARSGSDVVGCVTVRDVSGADADIAEVGLLCVDPPFQSSGLGARLLTTAERLCAAMEVGTIRMKVVEDRKSLIAWYERAGYRDTGLREPFPDPQDRPLDFAVLEKPLSGA